MVIFGLLGCTSPQAEKSIEEIGTKREGFKKIEKSERVVNLSLAKIGPLSECEKTYGPNYYLEIPTENEGIALATHIVAMADDAYLVGHPEWLEIVEEAKALLQKSVKPL